MKLLLAFLFSMFVFGGSLGRTRIIRRPLVLFSTCVVVSIMFYSRRII